MEDSDLKFAFREITAIANDWEPFFGTDVPIGQMEDVLELFVRMGFLQPGTNTESVICYECEELCAVVPERRRRRNGEVVLVHTCEERKDIGNIYFPMQSLRTWRVDFNGFARDISRFLELTGSVREIEKNRFWSLGSLPNGKRDRWIYLVRGLRFVDAERLAGIVDSYINSDSLILVFDRLPHPLTWPDSCAPILRLTEIASISDDGRLVLDSSEVERVKGRRRPTIRPFPKPPDTSWGKVVLRVLPPNVTGSEPLIEIQIGRRTETRDFVQMGMADARKQPPNPDSAWYLLLSMAKTGGRLTWGEEGASDKARAHMKLLRQNLCDLFQLSDDPFMDYSANNGWKAKFALTDLREAS